MPTHHARAPSQRQLRVGEEIRHALSAILMRGDVRDPDLQDASITVAEVRVSPDLRNATAFILPLGGERSAEILEALKRAAPFLRAQVSHAVRLRFAPSLSFQLDTSFDYADRISQLLRTEPVARDLDEDDTDGDDIDGDDFDGGDRNGDAAARGETAGSGESERPPTGKGDRHGA